MTVQLRLSQEGYVRLTGYQTTQWMRLIPAGATDPGTYADLFVFRQTEGRESFDRIATLLDFTTLPVNPLAYFEARRAGGDALLSAHPGDRLTILTSLPHWIQAGAPYLDQEFTVDSVEVFDSGADPVALPGNRILLDRMLTPADIGRWVSLSGFTTAAYNTRVQILSYEAGIARVDLPITTNETGTAWSMSRIRIDIDSGPTLEKRFFPTLEGNLAWEIRRSSTLVASGIRGYTQRENPSLEMYRAQRITTLERTEESAETRLLVCRRAIELLQETAELLNTSFLNIQTYDYPPL